MLSYFIRAVGALGGTLNNYLDYSGCRNFWHNHTNHTRKFANHNLWQSWMSCGFMNEQKKSLKLNYGLQDVKPCKILNNTTGKYFLTHIKFSNFDLFFCRFEFYLIQEFVPSFYQISNKFYCLLRTLFLLDFLHKMFKRNSFVYSLWHLKDVFEDGFKYYFLYIFERKKTISC